MTFGEAYAIFKQIDSDKYSDEEKGAAIFIVLNMETHNGVTKADLIAVVKYLFRMCFTFDTGKDGENYEHES